MTDKEYAILEYLFRRTGYTHEYLSPTQIGNDVGGRKASGGLRHSAWASPTCHELVDMGLAERNERGHYRITPRGAAELRDKQYGI